MEDREYREVVNPAYGLGADFVTLSEYQNDESHERLITEREMIEAGLAHYAMRYAKIA